MATTPEGKVKRAVSGLLKATPNLYYHMPVPGGYGGTTLDYIGCHRGDFFAVETKKPGAKPTDRQKQIIASMERSGGTVFVIDGDITELETWLNRD
jgi:hypothetical protein